MIWRDWNGGIEIRIEEVCEAGVQHGITKGPFRAREMLLVVSTELVVYLGV